MSNNAAYLSRSASCSMQLIESVKKERSLSKRSQNFLRVLLVIVFPIAMRCAQKSLLSRSYCSKRVKEIASPGERQVFASSVRWPGRGQASPWHLAQKDDGHPFTRAAAQ